MKRIPALILSLIFTCISAGNAYWTLCSDQGPDTSKIHASDSPCDEEGIESHHCESEVCAHGKCTDRPLIPEYHPPKIKPLALSAAPIAAAHFEPPALPRLTSLPASDLPAGPVAHRTTILRL